MEKKKNNLLIIYVNIHRGKKLVLAQTSPHGLDNVQSAAVFFLKTSLREFDIADPPLPNTIHK